MRYLLIFCVFIASCTQPNSKAVKAYKNIATEKLGGPPVFLMNSSSTYVLCKVEEKGTSLEPRNSIRYMVINIKNSDEIINRSLDGGSVKWNSEYEIAETIIPGNMRQGETQADYTKVFDVRTGEQVAK